MKTTRKRDEKIPLVGIDELLASYDALLFDAYGVLVRSDGAVAGAGRLVRRMNREDRAYLVLTNDASRTPAQCAERYRALGVAIDQERVITSGSVLRPWVRAEGLAGAPALAVGNEAAAWYARDASLELIAPGAAAEPRVVAVGEVPPGGIAALEGVVTQIVRAFDRGRAPRLVLLNPDLIYPRDASSFGLTAGAVAALIEAILAERYPSECPRFERVGKPSPLMFAEGLRRAGASKERAIMIGDQLATDVRGARAFGIDAALASTGISAAPRGNTPWPDQPTYLLRPFATAP